MKLCPRQQLRSTTSRGTSIRKRSLKCLMQRSSNFSRVRPPCAAPGAAAPEISTSRDFRTLKSSRASPDTVRPRNEEVQVLSEINSMMSNSLFDDLRDISPPGSEESPRAGLDDNDDLIPSRMSNSSFPNHIEHLRVFNIISQARSMYHLRDIAVWWYCR